MAKFLPKLSERTDRLLKLKKNETWNWGTKQDADFGNIKQMLTEGPCLAHYAKDKDNIVTTIAQSDWELHYGKNKSTVIRNR